MTLEKARPLVCESCLEAMTDYMEELGFADLAREAEADNQAAEGWAKNFGPDIVDHSCDSREARAAMCVCGCRRAARS